MESVNRTVLNYFYCSLIQFYLHSLIISHFRIISSMHLMTEIFEFQS